MLSGLLTAPFYNYDDGDGDDGDGDDGGDDDDMMKMKMVNMIGLGSVGKSFYRSCEKEGRSETEGKWALSCKCVLLIID